MKKALLISHHNVLDSGYVSDILFQTKYIIHILHFSNLKNLKNIDINSYNIIFIFGGKSSANDKNKKINDEYIFIKKIIRLKIPLVGFCLGAQMIAKIFDSKITYYKNKKSEIGYKNILFPNTNFFTKKDSYFMQFHNQGISYNKNMEVLAQGRIYEVDAFKIRNKCIYGFQFHPEVNPHTIKRWYSTNLEPISKYKSSLNKSLSDYKIYSNHNYDWLKKIIILISK